jgi:ubiquinone/menaquinone biosynthesis C-methylase UbiE
MTSAIIERFDRTAEGYLRWWAPVLAPGSDRLLDRLEELDPGLRAGRPRKLLDLGCGTGNVVLEAARRWPGVTLTGLDGSAGMLQIAARELDRPGRPLSARVSFIRSDVRELPVPDGSMDLVTCAYVLQQVPDRLTALREMFRVLRPGGTVGIVGWIKEKAPFAAEVQLEEALAECGIVRPPCRELRSGHYTSSRRAADELRQAGFRRVAERPDTLNHAWKAADFATYRETTRDRELFESLGRRDRGRVVAALKRRLGSLSADELVYRPPIVTLIGRRPIEVGPEA